MNDQSYSGQSTYLYVEPVLKERSNELLVISPYIGEYYAKMLVEQGRKKRVRVITSDSGSGVRDYAKRYSWGALFSYAKLLIVIFLLCVVCVYLDFYYTLYILIAAFALIAAVAYMSFRGMRTSNIDVRVPRGRFVHEKMYISDNAAITGSANLTYSGMRKNIEHVSLTKDPQKIDALRLHFNALWSQSA